MKLRIITGVLAALVLLEAGYIFLGCHPGRYQANRANRFKPAKDYDGFLAFDSETGQLCRAYQFTTPLPGEAVTPAVERSPEVRFVRAQPACRDLK